MNIIVVKDYDAMSEKCAEIFIKQLQAKPNSVLGLATGGSPVGTYKLLVEAYQKGLIDFKNVSTYNLDEYCGISILHPQSYYYFMHENLFNHVDIVEDNVHLPSASGNSENIAYQCEQYNKMLASVEIDIQLLGIGSNGHIAFNEPNTPFELETHVVELTDKTRQDNKRFFNSIDEVPTHAVTMGIKNIMQAKQIVMLISGKGKADTVKRLLDPTVSVDFPASILHKHPNVTVIIDEDAYSKIQ